MSRTVPLLLTCLFAGLAAVPAQAGWNEFWDRVHLDFHRNNCWSEPFSSLDRRTVHAPFQAMEMKGWRTQNTLGYHYFDPETQALNEAGQRKLQLILNMSPDQFRTVYVTQAFEQTDSEKRLDSVQQSLAKLLPNQSLPEVIPVDTEPRGWPAEHVDQIERKMYSTIASPRLPGFQAAGGGGGS